MTWNEICYPITLQYRKHWGAWEAIREIIQNSLDETEDFNIQHQGNDLIISDNGQGLAVKHLLFGVTEKKKGARGRFGEGLKIALIVLKRLGYDVTIKSNSLEVLTDTHEIEGEPCLKLRYRKLSTIHQGTSITIHGYTGETFQDRFVRPDSKVIAWEGKDYWGGRAMLIREHPTRLYHKDIYICELKDAAFSYNVYSDALKIEESRNIADHSSLQYQIGRIWRAVKAKDLIIEFFQAVKGSKWEATNVKLFGSFSSETAWREAFFFVYGSNAVLFTNPNWKREAEWLGAKVIDLPPNLVELQSFLPTDQSYVMKRHEESAKAEEIDDQQLTTEQLTNLLRARAIVKGLKLDIRVKAYKLPKIGADWRSVIQTIAIHPFILTDYMKTMDCLIHELAHAYSGASDLTSELMHAVSQTASRILYVYRVAMNIKARETARDWAQRKFS